MIGWFLRQWQRRYPRAVLVLSLMLTVGGLALLTWWVLRDLSRGMLLRPALAVLALALLSVRVIVSFRPRRR